MSDDEIKVLETLIDEELFGLRSDVNSALKTLEKEGYTIVEDWKLPKSVSQIAAKQYSSMDALTKSLQEKSISLADYNKLLRVAIQDSFTKAYAAGKEVGVDKLTLGDVEYLKRAVDAEIGFATKFGQDIVNDRMKMSRATRAGMYGQSVEGIGWNGRVEKCTSGTRIDWVLGCFTSDLLRVLTKRGEIPLRDVQIGELVWTHKKRWRRVLAKPVKESTTHGYAVLVGENRLIGLTDDHLLWTSEGWLTAREVVNEKIRRIERRGFQIIAKCWQMVSSLFGQFWKKEESFSFQMAMGTGTWFDTAKKTYTPYQRGLDRRQNREFDVCNSGRTQSFARIEVSKKGKRESVLERWQAQMGLFAMWKAISNICSQWRSSKGLFKGMFNRVQKGSGEIGLRCLRGRVRTNTRQDKVSKKEWKQGDLLLSQMFQKEKEGSFRDPSVRLLWEEFRKNEIKDRTVNVGEVFLLKGLCEQKTLLYDLTVEEDYSFVVEGMVVHNSAEHCSDCITLAMSGPYTKNSLPTVPRVGDTACRSRCQCHLRFVTGKVSKKERDAAAIYEKKREESLYNLMSPDVPVGMRKPNSTESRYIAKLRNKINFYRRKIALFPKAGDDFANAIKMRKKYNAELIEFVKKEGIYEVPVYSVDDVISGEHLGARAKRQIFADGFDSGSFDLLERKAFDNAISTFEMKVGTEFGEAKKDDSEVIAIPYKVRERGPVVAYNLLGETLEDTFLLLSKLMKLSLTKTTVQIAPFDDQVIEKIGIWIQGDVEEIEQLLLEVQGNGETKIDK
jgi:hypothetical protein